MGDLIKSKFCYYLSICNDLDKSGIQELLFFSGMLFNDKNKWWGDKKKRSIPHEGIDIYFYRDNKGKINTFLEKTNIPAIFNGKIVQISDDFLGKSIFVKHDFQKFKNSSLYSIYGHTKPYHKQKALNNHLDSTNEKDLIGNRISQGDIIATIAVNNKIKKNNIPSHLHISFAWINDNYSHHDLDWKLIGKTKEIIFCNPLDFIACKYKII
jgi:hypothetical protein